MALHAALVTALADDRQLALVDDLPGQRLAVARRDAESGLVAERERDRAKRLQRGAARKHSGVNRVPSAMPISSWPPLTMTVGSDETYAQIGYLRLNRDISDTIEDLRDKEELRLAGRVKFARYWSVFGATVLDLSDNLENYTILQYVDSNSRGYTTRLFACNGSIDPANPSPFALFTVQPCQQQLSDQAASGQDGFYDLYSTVKTPITLIEEKRFINTLAWNLSDEVTLKNILAYTHLLTKNGSNIFGTYFQDPTNPAREFSVGASVVNPKSPVTNQESYVAELQLQGTSFSERMIWQTGAYYETSKPDGPSGNIAASFLYCDLGSLESGDPAQFNCNDPLAGALGGVLVQEYETTYLNQAVYAQGTFDFLESLSASLGLRYTWDETEAEGIKTLYRYALSVQQTPTVTVQTPSLKSTAPTGMLTLEGILDDVAFLGTSVEARVTTVDPSLGGNEVFRDPERLDEAATFVERALTGAVPPPCSPTRPCANVLPVPTLLPMLTAGVSGMPCIMCWWAGRVDCEMVTDVDPALSPRVWPLPTWIGTRPWRFGKANVV